MKIQFGYLFHLFSLTDHPNLVIYPAIVGSMASETVKVFKTDQEQEEDTLPEEVKFADFFLHLIFLAIHHMVSQKTNFEFSRSFGCEQILLVK